MVNNSVLIIAPVQRLILFLLCAVGVIYACLFIGLLIVRFRRTQESFGYLK